MEYFEGPTGTVVLEIDMSADRVKELSSAHASVGDAIVHSICSAVKDYPEFRAGGTANICYLMNLGEGTETYVIEQCADKPLASISSVIKEIALKYMHHELPERNAPAMLTVSNLISFNALLTVPPVLKGQIATVAFTRMQAKHAKVLISITYDCSQMDCQRAIKFLNSVKKTSEGSH